MFAQYKGYIYLAIAISLIAIGAAGAWQWQEVRYLQLQNQIYADNKRDQEEQEKRFKTRIEEAESNRAEYLKQIQEKTHENNTLSTDLESGRKRMRILVLRQDSCKTRDASSAGGAEPEFAELDPTVRQHILDFRQSLIEREALFEFCRTELKSRSSI